MMSEERTKNEGDTPVLDYIHDGMELLDANRPGWRERISCNLLDLGNLDYCVLGQEFGSFYEGKYFLEERVEDFEPCNYGFDVAIDVMDYEELTELWCKELQCKD